MGMRIPTKSECERMMAEMGMLAHIVDHSLQVCRVAGLLAPEEKEEARGVAEVRQVFSVSCVGKIAGCYVTDGTINRNCSVRVVRDARIVLEKGQIASLRRFKDDAKEVRAGFEWAPVFCLKW